MSFFSAVLLALVGPEYRYLREDVGSSGSSSNAQIFNQGKLRQKIEDATLGIPPPEPLEGGPDLQCFLLGETLQQNKTAEKRIPNYRISIGRRVVENAF